MPAQPPSPATTALLAHSAHAVQWSSAQARGFWESATTAARLAVTHWCLPDDLIQAVDHALAACHPMPKAFGAWMLAGAHIQDLDSWRARAPSMVPSLAELATHPLDSPVASTALHRLLEAGDGHGATPPHAALIARVLADRPTPDAPDGQGMPPLACATRLEEARALIKAGADPGRHVNGTSVLARAFSHDHRGQDPAWVDEWAALLHAHVAPPDRPWVMFTLAARGQAEIIQVLGTHWSLHGAGLDALQIQAAATPNSPVQDWRWPNWLAFHALTGLYPRVRHLLQQSVDRQGPGLILQPATHRLWLSVLAHDQDAKAKNFVRDGTGRAHDRASRVGLPDDIDHGVANAALANPDLPLAVGGWVHRRPLRAWLVNQIKQVLAQPGPVSDEVLAGAWRLATRFLLEQSHGELRMPQGAYRATARAVLMSASAGAPPSPADPRAPVIWLAMATALEEASRPRPDTPGPILPGRPDDPRPRLPVYLKAWLELPVEQLAWSEDIAHAISQSAAGVDVARAQESYGPATEGSWLAAWETLAARLRAHQMDQVLPQAAAERSVAPPRL